jgi:hypothetical protein
VSLLFARITHGKLAPALLVGHTTATSAPHFAALPTGYIGLGLDIS